MLGGNSRTLRALLLTILVVAVPATALVGTQGTGGSPSWSSPGSPAGAAVWGLGGSSEVLVASTIQHGAFVSHDNGQHWAPIEGMSVDEARIAFDPTDPSVGYIAGFGGVARTTDAGQTWELILQESPAQRLDVSPSGTLAVTARVDDVQKVHLSTDQGDTWTVRDTPADPFASAYGIAFGHTDQDLVFATIGDVWASHDGGQTWTHTGEGTRAMASDDTGTIWRASFGQLTRSEDDGQTWMPVQTPDGITPDTLAPVSGGGLLGASGQGVLRTLDDGQTWEVLGDGEVAFAATALLVDPQDPQAILMGDENIGVSQLSLDGQGNTVFESRTSGFPAVALESLSMAPDGSVLLAGGPLGAYKSLDGGVTWSHMGAGLGFTHTTALAAAPGGQHLYVGGQNWVFQGYLQASHDGGQTWTTALPEANDGIVRGLAVDAADPQHAWAAMWVDLAPSKVYETHDGGQTWQPTLTLDAKVFDVAFAAEEGTALAATEVGVFAQDPDTGAWAPVHAAPLGSQAVGSADGVALAAGQGTSLWQASGTGPFLPFAHTGAAVTDIAVGPAGTSGWAVNTDGSLHACQGQAPVSAGSCQEVSPTTDGVVGVALGPGGDQVWAATASQGVFTSSLG